MSASFDRSPSESACRRAPRTIIRPIVTRKNMYLHGTMNGQTHTIERLVPPASDSDLRDLAGLLVDAVESGAAVSFLAPLTPPRAEEWWRKTLSASPSCAVVLVAR